MTPDRRVSAVRDTRASGRDVKVAYLMSRFPKITETFVLYEILALEKAGVRVEVFPLLREHEPVAHAEAQALVARAHYRPFLSWAMVGAHLHYLARAPLSYLGTIVRSLTATIRSPNFFFGALGILPKTALFAREMERAGVTHVHAHFANHPALAALIVHRFTGIPYSFTAHGSDLHVDQTALAWKLAEAKFAVTVSAYNRAFVAECVGPELTERLHVVHCGIDPTIHARAADPGGERLEILCVAALREVKGHAYLIEACRLLKERGTDFRCHLVGDGPLAGKIRELIRAAGLDEQVVMHGPLPRHELIARMADVHVLVLPSVQDSSGRREGIPVTLMEAMSCALPVVASDISGIPELVESERSGILTPPGDAAAIAAALERLHSSPELRERLGRAGRERVTAEFNLEKSAERLARLFAG